MDRIIFTQSPKVRTKNITILLLSIIIMLTGAIYYADKNFFVALGLVILSFFNFLVFRNLKNRPRVIVAKTGIRNRTNGMGLIEWKYIDGFEIKNVWKTEILVININDPEVFLNNMNGISKRLMQTNINKLGSPAVIPSFEFHKPLEEVIQILEKYQADLKEKGMM